LRAQLEQFVEKYDPADFRLADLRCEVESDLVLILANTSRPHAFWHRRHLCASNRREKSEKCAAFIDRKVFTFANQHGQAHKKKKQAGDRSLGFHQELEIKNGSSSSALPESSPLKKPLYVSVLILLPLLVFLVYLRALASDFVRYDDKLYVTENVHVQRGLT
jgi:hypothetical protein